MEFTLKLTNLYFSTSIALTGILSIASHPIQAIELSSLSKVSASQLKTAAKEAGVPLETDAMISYTAKQLNLSESTVSGSLGALLKVAQDNLSPENYALINKAVPDAKNYLDKAPEVTKSSITSLLSNAGDTGKKAESLDYLNAACEKLGISRQKIPQLVNSFSTYLDKSGYQEAASSLKKGLSFL
jgi:hypothetical protein